MAIATNTFTRFEQIGVKEQLSNIIYNISPEDTPGMSNAGRGVAENSFVEWQQDSLAAAATNAHIDGDDAPTATAVVPTVRIGNYCQISIKTPLVSDRTRVMKTAGRSDELAYQVAKMGAELKRDMELIMFGTNQVATAQDVTTAPLTAGLMNWLKTNFSNGGGAAAEPSYTTLPNNARTDGTQRAFTEAILKASQAKCFTAGGKPTILMVGPVNKQRSSGFAGIAALTSFTTGNKQPSIIGAASVYVGDFGTVTIVPNRFQRERDAFLIDPDYLDVLYLRPFKTVELAKTGDAEKRMLLVDYQLKVGTEKAHAMIADLTTT